MLPFTPDDLVAALADPLRRRILTLLTKAGTLCVCELVFAFDAPQPRVSQHLGKLRAAGLVRTRRIANRNYYEVAGQLPRWTRQVLDNLAEGAVDDGEVEDLLSRLDVMPGRPPAAERVAAFGQGR